MVETTPDPPDDERNTAKFRKWVRAAMRNLVSRKTFFLALSIIFWGDRLMRALKRLLGDF